MKKIDLSMFSKAMPIVSCLFFLMTLVLIVTAQASDFAGSLHVETIEVLKQHANYRCPECGGVAYGSALVYVVDQEGNPVPYAVVLGEWSDILTQRVISVTNSYGWAFLLSELAPFDHEDKPSFTFCIKNIFKTAFIYNPTQNALLCASSD